jgi:hypothetical protein
MAERPNERANIPNSPACGQWETLLVDALDGALLPEHEGVFSGHLATCAACTEMFEQVRRGREWLEFLAPEPEAPAYLLDRILVGTGHGKQEISKFSAGDLAVAGGPATAGNVLPMPPAWQRPGFAARMRRFAEPRLLMTAAMAFFSIALTLSMTGVRFTGIKMSDLRPAAVGSFVERRIMTASTPIIRYYDHLRFVYEVESRMKELRRSTEIERQNQRQNKPAAQPNGSGGDGETHRKDGGSKLNPNEAPQQTVNPPSSLWGNDVLEAKLETSFRRQSQHEKAVMYPSNNTNNMQDFSKFPEAFGSLYARALAMPERSNSCIA